LELSVEQAEATEVKPVRARRRLVAMAAYIFGLFVLARSGVDWR
jgi:phage terminase Nu1 subunit (DNA packaging protein)